MRITRAKNPDVSLALIPWFVPSDMDRLQIGWELHEMLRERPDETLCMVATENGVGQAMLIAYCGENGVTIWQARTRAGFKYQNFMFQRVIEWAKSKGFNKLKIKPTKNKRRFFERRYGFSKCANGEMEKYI